MFDPHLTLKVWVLPSLRAFHRLILRKQAVTKLATPVKSSCHMNACIVCGPSNKWDHCSLKHNSSGHSKMRCLSSPNAPTPQSRATQMSHARTSALHASQHVHIGMSGGLCPCSSSTVPLSELLGTTATLVITKTHQDCQQLWRLSIRRHVHLPASRIRVQDPAHQS